MINKYSWDFDKNTLVWCSDTFNTVDECIEDAKRVIKEDHIRDFFPSDIYIGINEPFVPWVDSERVLEYLQEQAADFAGEMGDDWESYDWNKKNELDELSESLTKVVNKWLTRYGYKPGFYSIRHIKKYPL